MSKSFIVSVIERDAGYCLAEKKNWATLFSDVSTESYTADLVDGKRSTEDSAVKLQLVCRDCKTEESLNFILKRVKVWSRGKFRTHKTIVKFGSCVACCQPISYSKEYLAFCLEHHQPTCTCNGCETAILDSGVLNLDPGSAFEESSVSADSVQEEVRSS